MQNYLLKFTPQQLQANTPVLNNSVFAEGFENWSVNIKVSGSDLLITLRAQNYSGGTESAALEKYR